MEYRAELEIITGIVRVFPPGKTFEDNFTWCCTVKTIDMDTCEICGVLRSPTTGEWKAIIKALEGVGFSKARWLRIKDGKHIWKDYIWKKRERDNREGWTAEFETIVGMVRLFPLENKNQMQLSEFDDWTWCCTIKRLDHETCEICGVLRSPNKDEWKSIIDLLKSAGFRKAKWLRIVDGKHIWKEYVPKPERD